MAILVKYLGDGSGYVPNYELGSLIMSGKIAAFKRSSGDWVDPKVGPVRELGTKPATPYQGPERRSRFNNFNPLQFVNMVVCLPFLC